MAEPAKRAAKKVEPPATLVSSIKTAPKLSAPKDARAQVDGWLDEMARTGPGKALRPLLTSAKPLGDARISIEPQRSVGAFRYSLDTGACLRRQVEATPAEIVLAVRQETVQQKDLARNLSG